jgi:hypothetical protein
VSTSFQVLVLKDQKSSSLARIMFGRTPSAYINSRDTERFLDYVERVLSCLNNSHFLDSSDDSDEHGSWGYDDAVHTIDDVTIEIERLSSVLQQTCKDLSRNSGQPHDDEDDKGVQWKSSCCKKIRTILRKRIALNDYIRGKCRRSVQTYLC